MCHMTFLLSVPPLSIPQIPFAASKHKTQIPPFSASSFSNPNLYFLEKSHQMNFIPTSTTTGTTRTTSIHLLFALVLGSTSYTFLVYYIGSFSGSSAAFYLLAAVVLVLVAVVFARVVIVAWITVLVLLTFAGNRRRVLVRESKKITADIGSYLIRVLISERKGAFTFVCAAIVSLLAMAGLVESVSLSQRW